MLTGANITINVEDLDRSIHFYTSLGFEVDQRWGNHFAQLSGAGISIGLHPTDASRMKGDSGNVSIGLTVTDFATMHQQLRELNIEVAERSEEGGRFLHFRDPDGNSLYVID
ncbi:MAG: VOC family protein, partial [Saprospiraceae bacterium]|nr:VOC family protein [Saprospiraceae bacterium]